MANGDIKLCDGTLSVIAEADFRPSWHPDVDHPSRHAGRKI